MFFEEPSPEYWAPATYRQFSADGALVEKLFDMQFKRLKKSELEAIEARLLPLDAGRDAALLAEVAKAWRIEDDVTKAKTVIAFSPQTLQAMEDQFPQFTLVCVVAFYSSSLPKAAAHYAAKN